MLVPSDSAAAETKAPRAGGFDFMIVRTLPPVLRTVNERVAVVPGVTGPKWMPPGSMLSCGNGDWPVPESATLTWPPEVNACRLPAASPLLDGVKVTGSVIVEPAPRFAGTLREGVPSVNCEFVEL